MASMQLRKRGMLIALLTLLFSVGCSPDYRQRALGSQRDRGIRLQICYVLYEVRGQEGWDPAFAVFWRGPYAGTAGQFEIHGHPLQVRPEKKVVYALRPDYSAQELPLSEEEALHLWEVLMSNDRILRGDPIWEEKVRPHLSVIYPPSYDGDQ